MSKKNSPKKKPASNKKPAAKKKPLAKRPVAKKQPAKTAKKPLPKKSVPAKKAAASGAASFLMTDSSLTVTFTRSGKRITKTCMKGSKEYDAAKACIVDGNPDGLAEVFSKDQKFAEAIKSFAEDFLDYKDGILFVDGEPVPPELNERIVQYEKDKLPYMPLVNFWRNLKLNPSYRAVNGLFRFISKNHFPITDDGHFIAYKGVASDFKDLHTRKMDNSVGKTVELHRNQCDENPEVECASGLHVASYHYAHNNYGGGGNVVIECKVHPRDVVAVPFKDADEKMRCCRYEVIGISHGERSEQVYEPQGYPQQDASGSDDDEDDNEDDGNDSGY